MNTPKRWNLCFVFRLNTHLIKTKKNLSVELNLLLSPRIIVNSILGRVYFFCNVNDTQSMTRDQ